MSKKFEKVKRYYDEGLWSKRQVHDAVDKGWITPEEYALINRRALRGVIKHDKRHTTRDT